VNEKHVITKKGDFIHILEQKVTTVNNEENNAS